ncbi:hypothetical protein LTR08_001302 [Meristemomyces frigidus]|nr:hypothetical protein LTR08_001302 [Meristemomyces frigidus]
MNDRFNIYLTMSPHEVLPSARKNYPNYAASRVDETASSDASSTKSATSAMGKGWKKSVRISRALFKGGTLLVGPLAKFTSVQEAVLSLGNTTTAQTILILAGNYTEQVNITRQGPLTLLGQTTYPNDAAKNSVNIIWHNATGGATGNTYDNAYTSTLTIAPTFNSSTTGSGPSGNPVPAGTPFGNTNFRTYNLNFINDYLPYSAGPALALSMSYANAGFYYTQFLSYQDTVYVGKLGNAYMYGCIIGGQTDFFYGFGTLWVAKSDIKLRGCGGGITAWKGSNTTFVNHYDTTMAEYHDYGPGFNLTGRIAAANITIEMTPQQYAPYSTLAKVFQYPFSGEFGNVAWIDENPEA